jgi:hypothetical protein
MKKLCASQSGLFIVRVVAAVALLAGGSMLGLFSFASSPPNGAHGYVWPAHLHGRPVFCREQNSHPGMGYRTGMQQSIRAM